MKKSEIKVLLVEDDSGQGKAIQEALRRSGYEVRWCTNPNEAVNSAKQADYKLAIIDCLLPKSNGVELAEKLRTILGDELKIILTSGIYKDRSFSKEALRKTNAAAFLTKPFDLEKLLSIIEDSFADQLEAELPLLLDSLTKKELGTAERTSALENCAAVHGFDLPLIYSLIFGSNLTGQLNVVSSDGNVSILWFHNGRLTQVQLQDRTSYFGVLLVEMGFTSPEEVEDVLGQQTNGNPIGERLVAAHSLSPHAIQVVREEQMLIRLSKTVQNTFVDASFTPSDIPASDVSLDRDRFAQLCWDWICSKISIDWLKGFYGRWLEHPIELSDRHMIARRLAHLPGVQTEIDQLLRLLGEGKPLSDTLESGNMPEDRILPLLHLLLLDKLAHFGQRRTSKEDSARRLKRIRRMLAEAMQKDYFQILNVSPRAGEKEINKNYMELAKNFHPDRVEPGAPDELRQATEQLFARITEAYDKLKDPAQRANYARELHEGSAEKVLQNESLFEQGQAHLRKGKYKLALEVFARIIEQKHHRADVHIFFAWAKMKVGAPDQKLEKFLKSISEIINKVPPEDRHSAPYFYTKGLFYMQIGDLEKAKTNFKHALAMDPNFVEARRDLTVARSRLRSQGDAFTDFSTVVTKIFGRRKSR
jgi:curved DNA-binding protein CbpA/CheY-like chemotaxis protein